MRVYWTQKRPAEPRTLADRGVVLHVQRNRRPFTACGGDVAVMQRIRSLDMESVWVPCKKCFPPDLTGLRAMRKEPRKGWGR